MKKDENNKVERFLTGFYKNRSQEEIELVITKYATSPVPKGPVLEGVAGTSGVNSGGTGTIPGKIPGKIPGTIPGTIPGPIPQRISLCEIECNDL